MFKKALHNRYSGLIERQGTMDKFSEQYNIYREKAEAAIRHYTDKINCQATLKEAMAYSLSAGGKRIRPVMFLAALDMLKEDSGKYAAFAFALECIHTYSLIHDDLPAMDNDDFRRGKPSNHKVFGEGMAVLAGDALLNYAVEVLFDAVSDKNTFLAAKELVTAAGHSGMINGQAYDIYSEKITAEETDKKALLKIIHENKTGKLLTAPLTMASLISGGKHFEDLKEAGRLTGILFQYSDDILDIKGSFEKTGKTPGKDKKENKLTAVSVYGVKETKRQIEATYLSIVKIFERIGNCGFFEGLYKFMKDRNY